MRAEILLEKHNTHSRSACKQRCFCSGYELVAWSERGYINNIENGVNYPSMTVFFYICDYLGISPKEFFDTETLNPSKANEFLSEAKGLSSEQLDHLIAIAKGVKK